MAMKGGQVSMEPEIVKFDTLLRYTIKHNKEHVEELRNLAQKAKELGKAAVYDYLVQGVGHLNEASDILENALRKLTA